MERFLVPSQRTGNHNKERTMKFKLILEPVNKVDIEKVKKATKELSGFSARVSEEESGVTICGKACLGGILSAIRSASRADTRSLADVIATIEKHEAASIKKRDQVGWLFDVIGEVEFTEPLEYDTALVFLLRKFNELWQPSPFEGLIRELKKNLDEIPF